MSQKSSLPQAAKSVSQVLMSDNWNTNVINNLSLSHGDTDHATGLIKVMEACQVITLRMNMPWLYVNEIPFEYFHGNLRRQGFVEQSRRENQYLVELERMAQRNGYTRILPIFQGDTFGCFTVLAPSRQRYISLIPELKGPEAVNMPDSYAPRRGQNAPDASYESWDYETLQEFPTPPTSASNETSVVQLARFGDYHALFTGDVGPHGLTEAAVYAYQSGIYRRPNLFQIPHQGSRHNVTPTALDVWLGTQVPQGSPIRGWAACSVGTNKTSHPRKTVTNALLRRGYATQVARGGMLSYSRTLRTGWQYAPTVPFHTYVEEAA